MDPAPRPTVAQTQAALANLPDGYAAMGETLLSAPGITADHILRFADALDAGARERSLCLRGDPEARDMRRLASILRDAAPRYVHPPREPAVPIDAEAAQRRVLTHRAWTGWPGLPGGRDS